MKKFCQLKGKIWGFRRRESRHRASLTKEQINPGSPILQHKCLLHYISLEKNFPILNNPFKCWSDFPLSLQWECFKITRWEGGRRWSQTSLVKVLHTYYEWKEGKEKKKTYKHLQQNLVFNSRVFTAYPDLKLTTPI